MSVIWPLSKKVGRVEVVDVSKTYTTCSLKSEDATKPAKSTKAWAISVLALSLTDIAILPRLAEFLILE